MRITYIRHSAFLAEWEDIVCLFDYAEGAVYPADYLLLCVARLCHLHLQYR